MSVEQLTDAQIEGRIRMVEGMIHRASQQDWKSLPALNRTLQRLLDEQVRRDLLPKTGTTTQGGTT